MAEFFEDQFREKCRQVIENEGLLLYDFEYLPKSSLVRIYIYDEKTDSALIGDCSRVDRALSPLFEEEENFSDNVVLEVSSPGIFRHLRSQQHFEKVIGKRVKLALNKKLEGASSNKVVGILLSVNENGIELDLSGKVENFSFDIIRKANLGPEL